MIVRQINSRKVFITGQVTTPGAFPLSAPRTVLQLIALAGGSNDTLTATISPSCAARRFSSSTTRLCPRAVHSNRTFAWNRATPSLFLKNAMRIAWVGGGVAAVALALDLATVSAQSLQPPTRSTPVRRTAGANQLEQQLIVEGDLFGGYDDNLNLTSTSDPFVQHPGGALGYAEADLRYSIQNRDNGLNLNGRAYWNTYSNVGASLSYGVEQSVHARTTLGRKTRIEVNEGVRYVPFFTLGAFGSLTTATAGNTPDANPVNGLFQTRSTFADASGSIRQELTRRLTLTAMYAFADSNYADSTFSDSRGHRGSVVLDKVLGRTDSINATYSRAFDTFHDPTGNRDVLADTLQGGYQYRRQVSRTRQLSVGVGGGAIHVDTTTPVVRAPLDYWLPSGYLTARSGFVAVLESVRRLPPHSPDD